MSRLLLKFSCLNWIRREGSKNCSWKASPIQYLIYECQCWHPLVHLFYLWSRKKNVKVTIRATDKLENLASHFSCNETLKLEWSWYLPYAIHYTRKRMRKWYEEQPYSAARKGKEVMGNVVDIVKAACYSSAHAYSFSRCHLTSPSKAYFP